MTRVMLPIVLASTACLLSFAGFAQSQESVPFSDYLKQAAEKGASRWSDAKMPIKVYIKEGKGVAGYRPSFKEDLEAALKQWSTATSDRIRFQTVSPDKAAMTISWTEDRKEMMSSNEGGHTEVMPDDKGIVQVTMKLLTTELDGSVMPDAYATHLMLHEIGHALGILGHSPNPADIMYYMINPGDTNAKLSAADVVTMLKLYSPAGDSVVHKPIDLEQIEHAGDSNSPLMQAIRLNDEAAILLQNSQYAPALHKLEEAHTIAPSNALITKNLGALYANLGNIGGMMGKLADAEKYYKKAIPLLEQSPNNQTLIIVLKNYATILRSNGRLQEAVQMEAKIKNLK
ncbi:MAG: matrixin family metalloprotease [Candidatus Obscuribacterales bacterium]|nr:matrixin family metalloprotease [Candidatus Obscuribacterales bacterium]